MKEEEEGLTDVYTPARSDPGLTDGAIQLINAFVAPTRNPPLPD